MHRILNLAVCVLVPCLLFATGCDDIKLPFPTESETSTAEPAVQDDIIPASKTPDSIPVTPTPVPEPTAESVLTEIISKPSMQITDEDLQKFSEIEEGLDVVTELNLSGARLTDTGLKAVAALPALKKLNLQGARFHDTHWNALASATNLEWLNISKSTIHNSTMAAFSGMIKLKYLDISNTRVSDPGFVHLTALSSLEHLVANGLKKFEGSGIESLGRKGAQAPLRIIHASGTMFGTLGFIHVRDFDDLQELVVNSSMVTDNSLSGLKRTSTLVRISLSGNTLVTDTGLKSLKKSKNLVYLHLNGIRKISDYTLKGFAKHKNLKELLINDSACTLAGVQKFKKAVPECLVKLHDREY